MSESTGKTLVLFDFDGTITRKDSFGAFLRFSHPVSTYLLNAVALSPMLLLYKLGIVSAVRAKEMVLHIFYEGWTVARIVTAADGFDQEILPHLLRPKAMEQLEQHKEAGHTIAVVSASVSYWLVPFCRAHGIELIATKLQVTNNILTGGLDGENCNGAEKARRIQEHFTLSDFSHIVAYGDSEGDKEMLALANETHFKPFQ